MIVNKSKHQNKCLFIVTRVSQEFNQRTLHPVPGELPSKFTTLEKLHIWTWFCDANVDTVCIGLQIMLYGKSV